MLTPLRLVAWLVGPPGVGKTTAARTVLGPGCHLIPTPKWTYSADRRIVAAGHYTGATFDGADTVPYSGAGTALDYFRDNLTIGGTEVVLFDGDRFSHTGAVSRVREACSGHRELIGIEVKPRVICVSFEAPEDLLVARRTARGSNQNPAWVKGRVTKAARFPDLFPEDGSRYIIDASRHPDLVAATLRTILRGGT